MMKQGDRTDLGTTDSQANHSLVQMSQITLFFSQNNGEFGAMVCKGPLWADLVKKSGAGIDVSIVLKEIL